MIRTPDICPAALFLLAASAAAAPLTGPLVNPANNHTYFLLPNSTWTAAEAQAVQIGGHLATIDNASEHTWIYNAFSRFNNLNRNLWIGLHDPNPTVNSTDRLARRAEFVWVSGAPVTYTNWSPFEPNNPLSGDPSPNPEFYVHLWHPGDPAAPGLWNNLGNGTSVAGFPVHGVVEIPALPGDANLDGTVDADDLALTDRGHAKSLAGWSNGDFTGDGAVTPADYAFLHAAYAAQHTPPITPIPEPAPLLSAFCSLLSLSLLPRRRRP